MPKPERTFKSFKRVSVKIISRIKTSALYLMLTFTLKNYKRGFRNQN